MDFLDVHGASGAQYRFRRADLAELPATAGNLLVATSAPRRRFLLCATARSLAGARGEVEAAIRETRGAALFIRLNVARTTREAEHADIVAAVQPEADRPDLG